MVVERRFKHFDWLHARIGNKFTVMIFGALPDKQMSGRFEEDFIERRRLALERYMNRLARHPVISKSTVFQHFLNCTDESVKGRLSVGALGGRVVCMVGRGRGVARILLTPRLCVRATHAIADVEGGQARCRARHGPGAQAVPDSGSATATRQGRRVRFGGPFVRQGVERRGKRRGLGRRGKRRGTGRRGKRRGTWRATPEAHAEA